jgi:orotidine-5'-phosphate decarboxylase
MPESFAARFAAARAAYGPLVWGVDPSAALLEDWGLGDNPDGLDRFADIILAAAAGTVGLIKAQSAFFERHGWRGVRTLQRLISGARDAGLLVIADIKRGDVASTNDAYAEAYLGKGAALAADAITVHPYLGLAAMGTYVSRAADSDSCLLVVTRSSNPEGRAVQAATTAGGRTVEQDLLAEIGSINATLEPDGLGPVGAVVGPTTCGGDPRIPPGSSDELDLAAGRCLFLAPGVGAQGATAADVARVFAACPDRVMPSASRSMLSAGPDVSRLRDSAAAQAAEFRTVLA